MKELNGFKGVFSHTLNIVHPADICCDPFTLSAKYLALSTLCPQFVSLVTTVAVVPIVPINLTESSSLRSELCTE